MMTAVFLGANHELLSGDVTAVRDGARFFLPYYTLVADFARSARLLVWNPWSGGGVPEFAEPQLGTLSPFTATVAGITGGTELGFRVYWLFVWWLGGAGVLLLARHLRVPAWGGFLAALGFLFSGVYTCGAPWISHLVSSTALPFVVWRADEAFQERTWRPAFEAGALWGLSSLGGYPGLTIATGCYLAAWGLGRWWTWRSRSGGGGLLRLAGQLLVVCLTGALVLSPTYVGFWYELPGYALRTAELSRDAAEADNPFAPAAFSTLASPFLAVLKARAPAVLWPETWVEGSSVYLGPAVVLLAVWGASARRPWRAWLVGLALVCFAAAVGYHLPLRGWLYDWFHPFRFFRHATILRLYGMFTLVVLALLASRDLASREAESPRLAMRGPGVRRALACGSITLVALAGYLAVLRLFETSVGAVDLPAEPSTFRIPGAAAASIHLVVGWGCTSAALLALWLARTRRTERLAVFLLGLLAAADGVMTVRASAPLMVGRESAEFWHRVESDHRSELNLTSRGLERVFKADYLGPGDASSNENLPPKIPALDCYNALWSAPFGILTTTPELAAIATGDERLWFASRAAHVVPSLRNAFAYAKFVEETGALPLVLHEPEALLGGTGPPGREDLGAVLAGLPSAVRLGASVSVYRPRELAFEVDCPEDGWLLVTDRWSRSWSATVDERPVEVQGGAFLFRAVSVHAGRNSIRFAYSPRWLTPLVVVSWGTLAMVGFVAACAVLRRGRARRA